MIVSVNKFKKIFLYILLALCFVISLLFVNHNHSFYDRTIAEVIETNLEDTAKVVDMHNNEDQLFTQYLTAEIKNGEEKGQLIHLINEYSTSGAYDQQYHVGNELFVSIDANEKTGLTGTIKDVKRDKSILIVTWIFIFVLLIVGKKQGLFSIISLAVNAVILSYALDIYIKNPHISLLWICGVCVILFTVLSLLLVNGNNEKTY
ncbi:YibE/F family protein, partial [Microvirga sp. 3-52]|nr:YibE/F family protein [Microvirga sp. 3-52]